MICKVTKQAPHPWDTPVPRSCGGDRLEQLLDAGFSRHPILTLTASMLAVGAGMLLAVSIFAFVLALPVGCLLGWL